ncbi:MAG: squalene-hopene/tetraprenyl-beta-curcumene cyclase [Planctomycetaceae bacterium]|jgi:squalene-hopene/tetraprenyl-beta-curcumene cyclase
MIDHEQLTSAFETAKDLLLAECRNEPGELPRWEGELSTSALSTATAIMALQQVCNSGRSAADYSLDANFDALIRGGLSWLADHQNEDGGWGDTVKSISNISTTMLTHAVFHATGTAGEFADHVDKAKQYIDEKGGVPAVVARYGKDKTFSVPILTHCALAGLVDWKEVTSLPFELACLPAKFYSTIRLPVVSYALPALIAIGQVKHHHRPSWNPIIRFIRNRAIKKSLQVLDRIQPPNGGFLEAAPLTSFVTMSLAGKGLADHVVVKRAVGFLCESVRPDGSWPIDTNLATWVTTLSINALQEHVPDELRPGLSKWLLDQQYKEVHLFTNAAPGGWAWTDLPGGVPDADDTPGAMLALSRLEQAPRRSGSHDTEMPELRGVCSSLQGTDETLPRPSQVGEGTLTVESSALAGPLENGVEWLLNLQNRDGGFPTFCRGWGTLPFDRSSPDITAHCLRALKLFRESWTFELASEEDIELFEASRRGPVKYLIKRDHDETSTEPSDFRPLRTRSHMDGSLVLDPGGCIFDGLCFLKKTQRPNGSWVPLWFGNQFAENDENPVYGTSRVLMAYRDLGMLDAPEAQRAAAWLASVQQPLPEPSSLDPCPSTPRGWGGDAGIAPSVEETALAAEVLLEFEPYRKNAFDGISWLIDRVVDGSVCVPTPIGFYFARLWYFERLYPLIFAVSALRRAVEISEESPA